jgi:hypothetical protein
MNVVIKMRHALRGTPVSEESKVDAKPKGRRLLRKALLVCGIFSSLLYGTMIGAIRFEGYSPISQTVSELSAIGAATRTLWMLLGAAYDLLVLAFGAGIWVSAGGKRALRLVGGLVVALGMLGWAWPFASMHRREVLAAGGATLSDTLHIILGMVTVLLMLVAIGAGATAFGKRFRFYSIATIIILVVCGALTGLDGPRIAANLPTPWVGLWERINIWGFLLWVVVLAIVLLRAKERVTLRDGKSGRRRITPPGGVPLYYFAKS